MQFLLSPAKSPGYDTPAHIAAHTQPLFRTLMKLSDALAGLNVSCSGARPIRHAHP
ncbi:MAG: hypothetical protein ACYCZL_13570 [Polaromonas sp.]